MTSNMTTWVVLACVGMLVQSGWAGDAFLDYVMGSFSSNDLHGAQTRIAEARQADPNSAASV